MGGGKKSKAPAAPDYAALQQSDALANRYTAQELTRWNRPTQTDAWGNTLSWTEDANGNWSQNVTQQPGFQQAQGNALNAYLNSSWAAGQQGGFNAPSLDPTYEARDRALSVGKFTDDPSNLGYFQGANTAGAIGDFDRSQGDQVAKDMFESSMSRLRPEQARTQEALDVKLRQQGLQPGTEAYNRAMQNEMTSQGDVNAKLGLDSTAAGYNAAMGIYNTNLAGQGQRYNQQLSDYQSQMAKEQQAYDQALGAYQTNADQGWKDYQSAMQLQQNNYNQSLQNYSLPMERAQAAAQLYSQAPRPEFAGFGTATGYSPADMTGAAQASYQAKMGNANASAGKKNSMLGAGTSLGSAFLGSK